MGFFYISFDIWSFPSIIIKYLSNVFCPFSGIESSQEGCYYSLPQLLDGDFLPIVLFIHWYSFPGSLVISFSIGSQTLFRHSSLACLHIHLILLFRSSYSILPDILVALLSSIRSKISQVIHLFLFSTFLVGMLSLVASTTALFSLMKLEDALVLSFKIWNQFFIHHVFLSY